MGASTGGLESDNPAILHHQDQGRDAAAQQTTSSCER